MHVEYVRIPENGVVTDQHLGRKTSKFTVGSSEVFPTLSLGVVGMTPGDRKRLTLPPKEAYGKVQRKLIRNIPRVRFPTNMVLQVGKRLSVHHGSVGRRRRVTVMEINLDSVLVDGNHPLAGKVIELEVMLISLVSMGLSGGSESREQDPCDHEVERPELGDAHQISRQES